MITATTHERPGVYSSYEASGLTAASANGGKVAVIAVVETQENMEEVKEVKDVYQWTSYSKAVADVGECTLSRLAQLAIRNGAGAVYGIPAKPIEDEDGGDDDDNGEAYDYKAAFAVMAALEDVSVVVCDSTEETVQRELRDMVKTCSAARKERIAVVGGKAGETVAELVDRAKALDHERVVLVAQMDDGGGAFVDFEVKGRMK